MRQSQQSASICRHLCGVRSGTANQNCALHRIKVVLTSGLACIANFVQVAP